MSQLFRPLKMRDVTFKNRIFVSPMCQYSSNGGSPTDWHLVHLGSRAVGGAALVIVEATAISPEGRISQDDSGIWADKHIAGFRRITQFVESQGSLPGIQLAHAGRKASTQAPWLGGGSLLPEDGGWQTIAPSPIPFDNGYPTPKEMSLSRMETIITRFGEAAERSLEAGFKVLEIHMAHGYLLHEFLSPLSNQRNDKYGGNFDNRVRFPLEVVEQVRNVWPEHLPLFVRISATDWVEKGWSLDQSIELARRFKQSGVDLVDCSSGGLLPRVNVPTGPGYQTPFAANIRREAHIPAGAVGMITNPEQAEHIIVTGQADAVLLARQMLRDPYWPLHAATALGEDIPWPKQYRRAKPALRSK